ncbi:hypothetical protein Droror1_Dr00011243 [Drosera rotundifolia]
MKNHHHLVIGASSPQPCRLVVGASQPFLLAVGVSSSRHRSPVIPTSQERAQSSPLENTATQPIINSIKPRPEPQPKSPNPNPSTGFSPQVPIPLIVVPTFAINSSCSYRRRRRNCNSNKIRSRVVKMGYTKEQLLARLKELDINFTQHEHPLVLTVEAQAQHVGHLGGALSKNLFLKDKKNRFYIVSALADTKVDMKVLSQRLGLGKGGVRMAPEEALAEILQVPLGCVTPFSLVNGTARHVSLILDQGFRSKECCIFHPLSNDMSIVLSAHDLDKFLKSIGRNPAYVDLEATPVVGKDQPPDLASLVPSDTTALSEPKLVTTSQVPLQNHDVQDNKPLKVTGKSDKQLNDIKNSKDKPAVAEKSSKTFADSQFFVNDILEKASALVISEITEENVKQHGEQLGAVVSNNIRKHLSSELNNLAALFKNAAYTEGFQAGIRSMQILFKG